MYLAHAGGTDLIGAGPELFVRIKDNLIEMRPIAGTVGKKPGANPAASVLELIGSEKERAEHLMLVDLYRNDIGRVCQAGSLEVGQFMRVEEYPHLYHMVSNVRGLLRPGPGHPADVGYIEVIRHFEGASPCWGVPRAPGIGIGLRPTGVPAPQVMHGKVSEISNDGRGVYAHTQGHAIRATRYHSLMISDQGLPDCLEVTSRSTGDGYIIGVRHRELAVEGVQFHPESILTEKGPELFRSFMKQYVQ